MRHRDNILRRMMASTGHLLRTASGCVLVLAVSVANASNVGTLRVAAPSAAMVAGAGWVAQAGKQAAVVAAAKFSDRLDGDFGAPGMTATAAASRRLALGVTDPPEREVLRMARLQAPMELYAAQRPVSPALMRSFLSVANRQRAP